MTREICISGFSSLTRDWYLQTPDHTEIWAMNEAHIYLKRKASRWFQIHPRNWNERKSVKEGWELNAYGRPIQHLELLQKLDVPIMQQSVDERIPMSELYPLAEIKEMYGMEWIEGEQRNYLTSTAAWMLAYAIYEHDNGNTIDTIHLSGIELAIGTEYFQQRPCVEYWCGFARGRGINITLPQTGASLLTAPVYAVDNLDPLHPESMTGATFQFNEAAAAPFAAALEDEKGNAIGTEQTVEA